MQEYLEVEVLKVTDDGEVRVLADEASYQVRVREDRDEPHIEVFSVVLTEIEADPGLYEAMNEVNRALGHSRIFWVRKQVVVAGELVGASAEQTGLACLIDEVARTANRCGSELGGVFGGKTMKQREED